MHRISTTILALCITAAPTIADQLPEGAVARVGSVQFWDPGLRYHPMVAFSPDGKLLATRGNYLCVWDVATGKRLFCKPVESQPLIGFHPDGKSLCVVADGTAV